MDTFFSQKSCDRCGGSLSEGRIMSMFNKDCICMKCKNEERSLPQYTEATQREREAVLSGDRNFPGIGLPV